jgi:hypothetical protein
MKKTVQQRRMKRLVLARESVRVLTDVEIKKAAGGYTSDDSDCSMGSACLCPLP